jgi:hypothetical protein
VNNIVQLASDPINIFGSEPLSVELVWSRFSGDDYGQVIFYYLDANKIGMYADTIYPGSGIYGFPAVPSGLDWFVSRAQGITPPTGARYLLVIVGSRQNTAPVTQIFIDSVSVYRSGRAMKAGAQAVGNWGYTEIPLTGVSYYNQQMGQVSTDPFYDRGGQLLVENASATDQRGYAFLCKEPGTYLISVVAQLTHVFGSTTTLKKTSIQIVKNGRYNGTSRGLRQSGTIIGTNTINETWTLVLQGHALQATVDLAENDTITLDLAHISGGGGNIVVGAGGGAVEYSYIMTKLSKAD